MRTLLCLCASMSAFGAHAQVYWDGTGPFNNNAVNGGTGTWNATDLAWTDAAGAVNAPWTPGAIAVFQGTAGTVTVDNSAGAITFGGMRFLVSGYSLAGAALTTNTAGTEMRVGDGTAAGSAMTATLGVAIGGTGGLNKTELGTLVLAGNNTYTGGTTISAGTLQLGNGGTGGSVVGNITNNAALVFNRSDTLNYAGVISGTGSVRQSGSGTTAMLSQSTYTGGTTVTAGTLQIGDSSNPSYGSTPAGLIRGAVTVNPGAALVVTGVNSMGANGSALNNINAITLVGATMTHTGPGDNGWAVAYDLTASTMQTTNASGQFTLGGTTTVGSSITTRAANAPSVVAGHVRLREGNPGNTLNVTVEDGAAAIDLLISATIDEAGGNPSTHGMTKLGPGNLTLTGANTWTAGTTLSAGTLQIGNGGTTGNHPGPIVDNAALVFNRSDALTHAGLVSGTGTLTQSGSGTLTLTAANTYSGGTIFNAGVLSVSSDANLGAAAGTLTFNGGTLLTSAGLASARNGTALGAGGIDNGGNTSTFSGVFSGAGGLTFSGTGTSILTGNHTYSGTTTIAAGTLQLGTGGTAGIVTGPIVDNGVLRVNRSDTVVFDDPISGTGALVQAGTGTTVLSATNTYTGGTTIASGTLQIGNATFAGDIEGAVVNNGTLTFARTNILLFDNLISGSGAVTKNNVGVVTLSAANTYTGATTVNAGRLDINGNQSAASGLVTVNAGATLGGTGTVGGSILVNNGGHIAPGASAGTLSTLGSLTLSPTAVLDYEFGQANTVGGAFNDLLNVGGNLTLDGTLNVSVSAGGTFLGGVYRVISYGGTLTDNGLALGTMPSGGPFLVQTAVPNQVNLVNAAGLGPLNFWDGANASLYNNAVVNGGSGTWTALATGAAWTDAGGVANAAWTTDGFAIFQGTPGVVTVDNGAGAVNFSGAQFATDGYVVAGAPLTSSTVDTQIRVGDGTPAGAAMTAMMSAAIQGSAGLHKTDLGTLVLAGANTYAGGTTIAGGVLSVAGDGNLGDPSGTLTFNGGRLLTTAALSTARGIDFAGDGTIDNGGNTDTFAGALSGAGASTFTGAGTSILTVDGTNTGTTTVASGSTLQLGNGGVSGDVGGGITVDGTLALFRSDNDVLVVSPLSGSGLVRTLGTGVSGQSSYRVDPASGGFTGAFVVESGARLLMLASNTQPLQSTTVLADGSLSLDVAVTYSSPLFLQGDGWPEASGQLGALRLANDAVASGPITLTGDSRITAFLTDDLGTVSGAIGDGGSAFNLQKTGVGAIVFTGNNTYTGTTTVSEGTLRINGTHASSSVLVENDATLGGSGTLAGSIDVATGGHLAPGNSAGTLTAQGDLALADGAILDYEFGQANVPGGALNDLLAIGGNLTLDGTLNVAVTPGGSLLGGVYRVISYGGALVDNGLLLGTVPAGGPYLVQTSVAQQVNLVNLAGLGPLTFWDGANTALFNNAQIDGGSGTWLASPGNDAWTDSTGVANAPWQADGFAVFQAAPGTVTVDNSAGAVTFSGAQFTVDGYLVNGAPLTTTTADTVIRVGDGTAAGAAMTATIDAVVQGSGSLRKTDLGTLVLTGANTYTGNTTIDGGTLAIDEDASLGAPAGALTINGGTLAMLAPVTSARAVTLTSLGGTFDNGGQANLFNGLIDGPGAMTVTDGTLILGADDTYSGGTTVDSGATLQLGNGGASGSVVGNVVSNGTLAFNRSDVFTFGGTVSGAGGLAQQGSGTTVLTADHTYTGPTVISAGTLQLGNGGGTGSVVGNIANDGALVIDRNNAFALGGVIGGSGTLTQQGSGTTTLSGANSYSGPTTVAAGTLLIDGDQSAATGAVNVASAATLGGIGVTGGAVTVSDGGHLLGSQGQVFGMASLSLGPVAQMDVTLTSAGTIGLFDVDGSGGGSGELVLDGQINLTAAGAFGPGVYRIVQYTGALDDRGLEFGTVPAGFTPNVDLFVQTAVAQQVNLINAQNVGPLAFWDSGDAALQDNGIVDGGNGTWQAGGNFAWTVSDGSLNTPWINDRFAIFQGTPGTVAVDNALGAVGFSGAQFAVDGYTVAGQPLTTNTAQTILRVGDGTAPGAAFIATMSTVIQGSGGIDKTDLGTLVLAADNTWSGGTTITAGTLQLGNGGTGGSVSGDIANNGALVFNRGDTVTYAGTVSGGGALVQAGAGTLVLSGASTYTGTTSVNAGTLQLDGSLGATATNVAANATLSGIGSIAGPVAVADGGHLAPGGAGIGTLTFGALMLAPASQLDYGYGAPTAVNDRIAVTGDLTLDGVLNIADIGGFGEGVYRVFDYGGALTDRGLALGVFPPAFAASDLIVQTAQPGQVNLVVSFGGLGLQFWDGAQTLGNGVVDGGSGTWNLATSNWTNTAGTVNVAWNGGFAVFAGAAGTVTLAESVPVGGLQFSTDGYRIVGTTGAQLQADASFDVRVDPGVTATVDAAIADGGAPSILTKHDSGTLVLGGTNTYSGGTSIEGGVLQVGADTNLGAASGALALDTGTLRTTGSFNSGRSVTLGDGGGIFETTAGTTLTLGGVVDGTGSLAKQGGGVLVLGGANTYAGGTTVGAGTVSVSADANLGAAAGALTLDGGALRSTAPFATARTITLGSNGGTFDTQADLASTGTITGTGGLTKIGEATLVLSGANSYTGATQVNAGTLRAGRANALSPTSAITVAQGGTLDLAGLDQTVSSLANAGLVWTNGQGTTRLNVTGAYVGQGGVLQLATVLAGDDSPSDRLVIDGGTATGTTGLAIVRLSGDGALTQRNGILVVDDVTGQTTAPGAFALVAPVFAGPYEYGLFRGSVDATNAQAWYLRSSLDCSAPNPSVVCPVPPPEPPSPTPTPTPTPTPIPNYRPEVSLYAALPGLALRYGRALLGTLHERVGEQEMLRGRDDLDGGDVLNGAWMRVIGLHGDADGDRVGIYGDEGPRYDFDLLAVQGGVDVYRAEREDGRRDHVGVGMAHGRIKSDVTHAVDGLRAGKGEVEGNTLSAYWTHYGRGGAYIDAVLQGTWFDADAVSTRGIELRTDEGGFGWGASLEAGLPLHRGGWTIEPQAQVVYQSIDDLTGRDVGARVRFDEADSLAARVGVRFARTLELDAAPDGTSRAVTGWLRLNYWHEFEAEPRTSFSSQAGDVPFTTDLTGGWGQLNLGVSAQLGRNMSIYANLNYENGLGGRYDAWDGSVGLRWNW